MTNVTPIFIDLTLEGAKTKIIENLKVNHHGKWVNGVCALKNLRFIDIADKALHALIKENAVETVFYPVKDKFDLPVMLTMYRYNMFQE